MRESRSEEKPRVPARKKSSGMPCKPSHGGSHVPDTNQGGLKMVSKPDVVPMAHQDREKSVAFQKCWGSGDGRGSPVHS